MQDLNLLFQNKNGIIVFSIFTFILGLFLGNYTKVDVFSNTTFKLFLFLFILYISQISISLAIILSLLLLIMYQLKLKFSLTENYENVNQSQYLENPLKFSKDLEKMNDEEIFFLTPKEMRNKMIEEGKDLLNIVQEMRNQEHIDDREKRIIFELENKGQNLIRSGIGNSENNEYSGVELKI